MLARTLGMAAPAAIFILLPGLALAEVCDRGALNLADHVATLDQWLRSLPDGDLVGTYPDGGDQVASISPDGRYLLTSGDAGSELYDVASGEALPLGFPERRTSGWSPDGHVVTTSPGGTVLVCAPTTGACTDTGEPAGDDLTVARGSYNSWS